MPDCSPNDGGCWFCSTDDDKDGWFFSMEFDAYFHPSCLKEAYFEDDAEAKIIASNDLYPEQRKALGIGDTDAN